jgi:hypothetical protein
MRVRHSCLELHHRESERTIQIQLEAHLLRSATSNDAVESPLGKANPLPPRFSVFLASRAESLGNLG